MKRTGLNRQKLSRAISDIMDRALANPHFQHIPKRTTKVWVKKRYGATGENCGAQIDKRITSTQAAAAAVPTAAAAASGGTSSDQYDMASDPQHSTTTHKLSSHFVSST